MKKWLHRIFVIFLLGVFVVSAVKLVTIFFRYWTSRNTQTAAVQEYTRVSAPAASQKEGRESDQVPARVCAPIEVDFARLKEANGDVVGWIFCEDSVISYPVLYGRDNSYYLDRDYLGSYDPSGSIFTDMRNKADFADYNVILYGHHMQDGTMFASLKKWFDQSYYEDHPVMWLLTPEQDYMVELFSAYLTTVSSETYKVYAQPTEGFDHYLIQVRAWSVIQSDVELEPDAHYVVLSTCAYNNDEGRTVLHGKLVPVNSAGGKEIR